jgi:hypothetical protein
MAVATAGAKEGGAAAAPRVVLQPQQQEAGEEAAEQQQQQQQRQQQCGAMMQALLRMGAPEAVALAWQGALVNSQLPAQCPAAYAALVTSCVHPISKVRHDHLA